MFIRLATAGLATALLVLPTQAAMDWSKYGNFSNVRCEDPRFIADMKEAAKSFRDNVTGVPLSQAVSDLKLISTHTLKATSDTLTCFLKVQYTQRGKVRTIHGRFIASVTNGRSSTRFDVGNPS
jgi:hypothetical protein